MHFPLFLHIGKLVLHPHLVFESLAYFIAYRVYAAMRRSYGDIIESSPRWTVITAAAVGAAAGSKLLSWFEDPRLTLAHLHDPAFLWGGKTIVGGLLGGWIAVELVKRALGIRQRTGDLFAIPICIGTAIGRIGCFLTGLDDNTYGTPTSLPWGVDVGDGIARHPVQLYEVAIAVMLAAFLWRMMRTQNGTGRVFQAAMLGYALTRVVLDYLKPYPRFFGLGTLQWVSLGIALYCAHTLWLTPSRTPHVLAQGVAVYD